jgi:heat shock protein HslJ
MEQRMFQKYQLVWIFMMIFGSTSSALASEKAPGTAIQDVVNKTWQWVATVTPVEKFRIPYPEIYTIRLLNDGQAIIKFDCNRGGGHYTIFQETLSFGPLFSTRMACPAGTHTARFMKDLQKVSSFFIEDQDLYLELPADSGTMRFQNAELFANTGTDPLNAVYILDDQRIPLQQGTASQPVAPESASIIETRVFGTPQYGDVNGDGLDDAVLWLQHNSGGSGTFFYIAAALYDGDSWQGTQALFLGDRIIPQSIEINNGVITIRYLERLQEEPMTAPATRDTKRTLIVKNGQLMNDIRS